MPDDAAPDTPKVIDKLADPLAAMRAAGTLVPHSVRPWHDILPDEMANEMLTRNGRFQIMVSFMRISPMAALVIDEIDRIIFMNASAERYWRVRVWDVRGKTLADIMNLSAGEKKAMRREHVNVLESSMTGGAQVFFEHFHNGSERMSMLKFPFTEDDDYRLIGCFVLPSNSGGDPKLSY
jgi:PAS domain-containing protein